jgi:hypothetical protein
VRGLRRATITRPYLDVQEALAQGRGKPWPLSARPAQEVVGHRRQLGPAEKPAAERLMKAVEQVTADPSLHTPDLGGKATTKQVTDAVCEALLQAND